MHVFSLLKLYKPFVFILSSLHPTPKWQFLLCSIHHLLWHTCNLTVTFRTNCIGVPVFKLHVILLNIVDFRHVASRRGEGWWGPGSPLSIFLYQTIFFRILQTYNWIIAELPPPPATFHDSELSFFSFLFFWLVKIFLNEVAPPAPPQIFKKDATCLNLNMNNNTDAYVYMQ